MTDPNIGRLLAKRYQLQTLIGAGAMGRVYRATDVLLGGVPVAIKFLTLSLQNHKLHLLERFEREAKTCALLGQKSIHIVRVMDYGVDENETPFYVMEYLNGSDLGDLIRLQPLPLPRFLSLARQICLGLQCAHQGIPIDDKVCPIIHRDIKPSNIVVVQDSSFGELIKVLDFGIAKLLQADADQTNYYLGTLAYSSPEQMEGKELDNRSDIYSLGVMMFEMLTGKMPVQSSTNSFGGWYKAHHFQTPRSSDSVDVRLKIPKDVESLVMSCLAKEPGDRPQTVGHILQTLVPLEQRYGTTARVEQPSEQLAVVPLLGSKSVETLTADKFGQQISWPKNKPIADIVFSHSIRSNTGLLPALWVMLPEQEIQKRVSCTRYNQFLFITSPHPMMLWISVLYNREHGPKWLPCYLDMKTLHAQQTARLLGETGYYRLLLFAREEPQRPHACLLLTIATAQCERLQQWAMISQTLVSSADPQNSKSWLKDEFEKLKPHILLKLEEGRHIESSSDISE